VRSLFSVEEIYGYFEEKYCLHFGVEDLPVVNNKWDRIWNEGVVA
jgi:hypothetical protein